MNDITLIQNKIYEIRGQRVMLDFDLAPLYQVQTKVLKQAVRRNIERFPADFMFEITIDEYNSLKDSLRSQFVISLEKRRRPREYGMKGLVDQARIDTGVCREGDLMGVSEREIQLFQYLAGRFS